MSFARKLLVVLALFATSADGAESQPLTAESLALIAPALKAFKKLDEDYAALPPTTDVAERLIRMGRRDQAAREAYSKVDLNKFPGEQRIAAFDVLYGEIDKQDATHQQELLQILPPEGWFAKSQYGTEAAEAAWLILQHSVRLQPDFMRQFAPAMRKMLERDEIDKANYASFEDRLAMMDGRYQTYGTQFICHKTRWVAYPIGDRLGVDERRMRMGISQTLADRMAELALRSCPGDWVGKLPEGARLGEP